MFAGARRVAETIAEVARARGLALERLDRSDARSLVAQRRQNSRDALARHLVALYPVLWDVLCPRRTDASADGAPARAPNRRPPETRWLLIDALCAAHAATLDV